MGKLKLLDSTNFGNQSLSDNINLRLEACLNNEYAGMIHRTMQQSEAFYRQGLTLAMDAETEEEAKSIVKTITSAMVSLSELSGAQARNQFIGDVGYFAGYYGVEVRLKVERLFETKHPFLGRVVEKDEWTSEELYQVAKNLEENFVVVSSKKNK